MFDKGSIPQANIHRCYLGGAGIAEALRNGADIVICGRVADAAPSVGGSKSYSSLKSVMLTVPSWYVVAQLGPRSRLRSDCWLSYLRSFNRMCCICYRSVPNL